MAKGVAACRQEGSYLPERGYGRYFALFRNCAWFCPPAGGWVLRWENLGMLWGVDSRRETLCPQVSCERCGPRLPGSRRAFPKTEKAPFSGVKRMVVCITGFFLIWPDLP